jgi:hypothetical protein
VSHTTEDFNKEDLMMNEIDHCYEPALRQMEFLYQKMTTVNEQVIVSRFQKLKEKWEVLQYERDELKSEQKEDRWLTVFKRVADQVDIMIDGLDRSVVQCYSFILQIKKHSNSATTTSTASSFTKGFSSFKRNNASTTTNTSTIPIDKDKFKSVEKSFEAKYKYYTPSIDRMLSMLGNGISARAARDNQTSQRHESMLQRWYHLKEVMEDLRTRDLIDTDRILQFSANNSFSNNISMSPLPTSTIADKKNPRFRTPEPTMTSQNRQGRFSHNSNRVRSATPTSRRNSLNKPQLNDNTSDSSSSTSTIKVVAVAARTPKPSKSIQQHKIDFYDEDEKDFGLDISKLTKRNDRIKDVNRNSRAKSSLGHLYKKDNSTLTPSLSTNRRSMTPSLIPRPKTPSKQQQQQHTQMPARPKSYQQNRTTSRLGIMPPVPALPKHIQQRQSYQDTDNMVYVPDTKDPLDIELSKIINSSPIQIQCQRASSGRYYFGSESSISINGGKKLYACKLMTYSDRKRKGNGQNKVLIRVGGGWQDLEFFLLEHSSFMSTNDVPPPKKKFAANLLNYWKN